jgi:hypothetical protein
LQRYLLHNWQKISHLININIKNSIHSSCPIQKNQEATEAEFCFKFECF